MLLHEWLQYRDRRIRKLQTAEAAEEEAREEEAVAEPESAEEEPPQAPAVTAGEGSDEPEAVSTVAATPAARPTPEPSAAPVETPPAAEMAEQVSEAPVEPGASEDLLDLDEEEAPAGETLPEAAPTQQEEGARPGRRGRQKTAQELLETLQPTQDVRARLQSVLARQQRLPIEETPEEASRRRQRRAAETREQLVARLLDPTLTLQETALLLGVCPTTVRRYTNRGILKCFRTPGNQRRFRLSDVLEFMERRDQGEV